MLHHLSDMSIGADDGVVTHIVKCDKVTHLELGGSGITDLAAGSIRRMTHLTYLELVD